MNEELKLVITSSPHLRDETTVPWIMRQVVLALLPATIWGIYFFGVSSTLLTILLSVGSTIGFEALNCKIFKKPLSITDGSAVITGLLLGLSLPPSAPFWLPLVGGGAAIFLGKEMFGGLGQNIFNPALVGRAVLLVSWPKAMSTWWVSAPFGFSGFSGGGAASTFSGVEMVTTPTPLSIAQMYGYSSLHQADPRILWRLFVGQVPGSIGEISALLLLIGFLYLWWRGVVHWDIPLSYFVGLSCVAILGGQSALFHILSGGAIMGACFMATDYVTSPISSKGRYIFGLGAGAITGVIRLLGAYPEGVTFGILTMNALVPFLDYLLPPRFGVKNQMVKEEKI
ncbi:MAG: RnfABCDGE type electron transport complex subunit D [Atribacterota bacterium]|nr:RnfABCDGE type electron transport complex subunit D [Atribacterota bacterium]